MFRDLQQFERTFCDCGRCVAACKAMPGVLAPGDMDRIAKHQGIDPNNGEAMQAFVAEHFVASEGAKVLHQGRVHQIPTIVPKQQADGRCVFLNEKDECTVYRVAPFGCAQFRMCAGPETAEEDDEKSKSLHYAIARSNDYMMAWALLQRANKKAPPIEERRRHLNELCKEIL